MAAQQKTGPITEKNMKFMKKLKRQNHYGAKNRNLDRVI